MAVFSVSVIWEKKIGIMSGRMRRRTCRRCDRVFLTHAVYNRHVKRCLRQHGRGGQAKFTCSDCGKQFTRLFNMQRHRDNAHLGAVSLLYQCGMCSLSFRSEGHLKRHRRLAHGRLSSASFRVKATAHKQACQVLSLYLPRRIKRVEAAHAYAFPKIHTELRRRLLLDKSFKYAIILHVELIKLSEDGQTVEESAVFPFRSLYQRVSSQKQAIKSLYENCAFIEDSVVEFLHRGSGWIINDIMTMELEFARCYVLAGGGCGPHFLRRQLTDGGRKKYVLDKWKGFEWLTSRGRKHKSTGGGNDCFYTAVASHFKPHKDVSFLRSWIRRRMVKVSDASCPVKVDDVGRFEKQNRHLDLSINVLYSDETDSFIPLRPGGFPDAKNQIVLLLYHVRPTILKKKRLGQHQLHYVRVPRPQRFFGVTERLANGRTYRRILFTCFQCFNTFRRKTTYESHIAWCHKHSGQKLVYPEEGETITFENRIKSYKSAYTIFFDFEALQTPPEKQCSCDEETLTYHKLFVEADVVERESMVLDDVLRKRWERRRCSIPRGCPHKTVVQTVQRGFAFHILVVDRNGQIVKNISYSGLDAPHKFCDVILDLDQELYSRMKKVAPMTLTKSDRRYLDSKPELCCLCQAYLSQPVNGRWQRSVRHHDHLDGRFIGLAHDICNFVTREKMSITAFSHNFSGYDSHIFLKELGDVKRAKRLKVLEAIPINSQKIKMLRVNHTVFLDSMAFLPSSLADLTETLVLSKHTFPLLQQWEKEEGKRRLLLRKGVYPYSFATSLSRLETAVTLPPIEAFTNDIGSEHISASDYRHAQAVYSSFGCKTMLDYTMLYLATDTYLLAEAVTSLRNMLHHEFALDLCQYFSLPMLTKDLMLKLTGVKIELLTDPEMAAMVRSGIRGGVSYVNTRFVDVKEEKEQTGEERSLIYVDANNLYGAAMSAPLPQKDFSWLTGRERKNLEKKWKQKLNLKDGGKGYILEVDLLYPEHRHLAHSSFPLAPEHVTIQEDMLSPYALAALRRTKGMRRYKANKLTSTFCPRTRYVVHGANLRYYLEQGMVLVKIRRGIKFTQAAFIKPYIDICTQMRAAATTKERKDLFKLLCNSLFGKWIENILNRMDLSFVFDEATAVRHNTHPLHSGFIVCGEHFSLSMKKKQEIKMNQAWPLGFSILDLSKLIMQRLYYDKIVPTFVDKKCSVVMTDTDSFVLNCGASSPDEAVEKLASIMDFSNYDKSHRLFSNVNKARVGYLKNEVPNDIISKFVGIRAKSYAFKTLMGRADTQKCKGVVKRYLPKISFDDYARCVQKLDKVEIEQAFIQSKDHVNRLMRMKKVAFTSFDDKRFLLCSRHSVPYGSNLISRSSFNGQCYFCQYPNLLY